MAGWAEFKSMNLPLWEVLGGIVVAVGVTWAAFAWADDVEDKQETTQTQLDQLITIVATSASASNEIHEKTRESMADAQKKFELLKQEMELRRELAKENEP